MSAAFWLCRIVIGSFSKIARQVAVGVSHAATCRVALRKVEAASTFFATCNTIFRCETSCKENCLVWHGLKGFHLQWKWHSTGNEEVVNFQLLWLICSSPPWKSYNTPPSPDKVQRVRIRSTNVTSPGHYKCSPESDQDNQKR